jgi:hypothetical protein
LAAAGHHVLVAERHFAGNFTDDPEARYTEGGTAWTKFRVAVSGR